MNRGRFQPRGEKSFFYGCFLALTLTLVFVKSSGAADASSLADPNAGLVTALKTDPKRDEATLLPGDYGNAVDEELVAEIKKGLTDKRYERCRQDIGKKLAKYEAALPALKKFAASTPPPAFRLIRKKEIELDQLKLDYLQRMRECGPCRTRMVSSWSGNGSHYWYATDGSCFIDESDAKTLQRAFDAATTSLRSRSDYLKFPHIVKVETLTADGKDFETSAQALANEFSAFLAIRTPMELAGNIQTYFYHIRNQIMEGTEKDGSSNFMIAFNSYRQFQEATQNGKKLDKVERWEVDESLPLRFQGWKVDKEGKKTNDKKESYYWISPSGRKVALHLTELDFVKGWWFITKNTLRYATVGDFFLPSGYIEAQANDVLLEALLEMYRRAKEGA